MDIKKKFQLNWAAPLAALLAATAPFTALQAIGTQIFDITGITAGSFPTSASATLNNSADPSATSLGVSTLQIGSRYYLFVADQGSSAGGSGTQIFDITDLPSGSFPTSASATLNNSNHSNAASAGVSTLQIGSRYYLFVADQGSSVGGSGTQIFDITDLPLGSFPTSASATLNNSNDSNAASTGVSTLQIGSRYYLFVADQGFGSGSSGTQIFDITGITAGSFPTSASATLNNSNDSNALSLGVSTLQIGSKYYLFVADNGSPGRSGTQIFDITDLPLGSFPTSASATLNNSDAPDSASQGVSTLQIGSRYYLLVADVGSISGSSGTQIFDITDIPSGSFPTSASATLNNSDGSNPASKNVSSLQIGSRYYLFVADNGSGAGSSGTQIFDITDLPSGSFPTSASATLNNSNDSNAASLGVSTLQIGSRYYLFVADRGLPEIPPPPPPSSNHPAFKGLYSNSQPPLTGLWH